MKKLLAILTAALAVGHLLANRRQGRTHLVPPSFPPAVPPKPLSGRPARQGAGTVWQAVGRAHAAVESHFRASWPVPAQAEVAARLFTGAVGLACAGCLVGLASVAAPLPQVAGGLIRPVPGGPLGVAVAAPALDVALVGSQLADLSPQPAGAETVAAPTPPAGRGALPIGKGMWLYVPEQVEGGDAEAIAARATAVGLTHLYVRTGSSRKGFYAQDFLNRLLPVAHAHGLRVYGWDFPYFDSWSDDVFRALDAINYTTPDGHRIDGFTADIETRAEGTNVSAHHATEYGRALRKFVGPGYPLIATIPRPSASLIANGYPFAEIIAAFDAVAPMVYWQNREPGADVAGALDFLSAFGKPVIPVGQAYDGAPEGGPAGVPSREQIIRFMQVAEAKGAIGVSFWSWQHADQQAWDAIADAAEFRLVAGPPEALTAGVVRAYQGLLSSLGFPAPVTGAWDATTSAAIAAYQQAANLPVTKTVDEVTRAVLLTPVLAPVQPQG